MVARPIAHVISVRTSALDGTGDAKRAASIALALQGHGIEVKQSSLLGSSQSMRDLFTGWRGHLRLLGLIPRFLFSRRPLQVLLVQRELNARGIGSKPGEVPVYVTSRCVPAVRDGGPFAVDFVDSLAKNARGSAADSTGFRRMFWLVEAGRLARWEAAVSRDATVSAAVSSVEAGLIGPRVKEIPIEISVPLAEPQKARECTALFAGNLFYRPNDEAAQWIVRELLPRLLERGWGANRIVIAGRNPTRELRHLCQDAGVTLKVNVPDLGDVMGKCGVMLVPLALGSGIQTKVLECYASRAPLLMTPRANIGLDIECSDTVIVAEREASPWAIHVDHLAKTASTHDSRQHLLNKYRAPSVRENWYRILSPLFGAHL